MIKNEIKYLIMALAAILINFWNYKKITQCSETLYLTRLIKNRCCANCNRTNISVEKFQRYLSMPKIQKVRIIDFLVCIGIQ